MAVDPQGWFDWATRAPGPDPKQYPQPNTLEGVVLHSMVGSYAGALSRLMSNERTASGAYTAYAQASWIGSVLKDGTLIQHYKLDTAAWTNGSAEANQRFAGFETEGGAPGNESEPLTPAQFQTHVRIIQDIMAYTGRTALTRDHGQLGGAHVLVLAEHNEMTRYGASPTACPSGRIPWQQLIQRITRRPDPVPPPTRRTMPMLIISKANDHKNYITNGVTKRLLVSRADREHWQYVLAAYGLNASVHEWPDGLVDAIPTVKED